MESAAPAPLSKQFFLDRFRRYQDMAEERLNQTTDEKLAIRLLSILVRLPPAHYFKTGRATASARATEDRSASDRSSVSSPSSSNTSSPPLNRWEQLLEESAKLPPPDEDVMTILRNPPRTFPVTQLARLRCVGSGQFSLKWLRSVEPALCEELRHLFPPSRQRELDGLDPI